MSAKKNCVEEWLLSKEQTEAVIEYYQDEECLWLLSSPDYYKKDFRKQALQRIIDKLVEDYPSLGGSSIDQLKLRLQNLRGYYTKEVAKVERSKKNGSDHIYTSPWVHFGHLDSFLRPHINPKGSWASLINNSIKSYDEDNDDGDVIVEYEDLASHCSDISDAVVEKTTSTSRKRKMPDSDTVKSEAVSVVRDIKKQYQDKSASQVPSEGDSDALFCRYIAAELRNIKDEQIKAYTKYRIQCALFECRFGSQFQNCANGLHNFQNETTDQS